MAQQQRSVINPAFLPTNFFAKIRANTYLGEALLVLILGFCLYAYTALLSFSPYDQSFLAASYPNRVPLNLCGVWGAYLSSLGIYYFGLHSFLAPMLVLTICYNAVFTANAGERTQRLIGLLGVFGSSLILIAKASPVVHFSKIAFPVSGVVGLNISNILTKNLGLAGSTILLTTTLGVSVLLCLQRAIIKESYLSARNFLAELWQRSVSKPVVVDSTPEDNAKDLSTDYTPALFSMPMVHKVDEPTNAPIQYDLEELDFEEEEAPTALDAEDDEFSPQNHVDYNYTPPSVSIFKTSEAFGPLSALQKKEFESTAKILTTTFDDFGIKGSVVAIQPGPVVTVFEFQPDAGTKLAKINSLVDDLALSLKVDSIIMHPVRGKRAVGIQVPNTEREMVRLGDIIQSTEFTSALSPLTLALGKSIAGDPICADLTKMPHLLTAGATGSGKSVAINTLLCSVIMKASPQQVRMILVDPKMLELSMYEGIPHLLMPVITQPERAAIALKWATQEMERRYRLMQHAKVRNIVGFNEFCRAADKKQIEDVKELTGEEHIQEMPFILIVIDELADLMMTAPKEVEGLIQRLAQKARASGIHLVLATQRPSVDIITGVIKANLPCRAAFQVVSKHDSRTILDQIGADKLLGNGDMLFQRPGSNRLERIQGAFISDEEVVNLVDAVKKNAQLDYDEDVMRWIDEEAHRHQESRGAKAGVEMVDDDPHWDEALQIASNQGAISASYLQRQLKIGYNRAARIVETMEAQGLVAKADGAKPRKWLGPTV